MRILLDTCTFLWIAAGDPRLSATARASFEDPGNEVFLSSVSAWEIAIKHSLGRLPLPESPGVFVPKMRRDHAIEPLPLDEDSTLHLGKLPPLQQDPFDRMLASQAIVHGLAVLTPDQLLSQYPVRCVW